MIMDEVQGFGQFAARSGWIRSIGKVAIKYSNEVGDLPYVPKFEVGNINSRWISSIPQFSVK